MPFRRRSNPMKRRINRARVYRKKRVIAGAKKIRQPVQYFKRSVYTPNAYTSNNLTDVFFAQVFRLNDLPNFTEFQNLYDQYCIKGVKVTLMPKFDTATQTGTGTTPTAQHVMNRVVSCLDYDDNTALTNIGEALQYQNHKMSKGIRDHSRYFKPKALLEAYGGIGQTHYMPKSNMWIDIANANTPHYALKWVITSCPLNLQYDMKVDYYLAFKNVR